MVQESKYNPYFRNVYQGDVTEEEERTFYPKRAGNFDSSSLKRYRELRSFESNRTNQGYLNTKSFQTLFSFDQTAPFIRNTFSSRIFHSERDIVNQFENNYRIFLPTSFRDYEDGLGVY